MELSDIWEKIANNARLTPAELEFLKRSAKETQQRNSFISGNTTADNRLNFIQTFENIYSSVFQSDTASVLVNIPSEYNHVFIISSGRTDYAAYLDTMKVQFNGDTGAAQYQWGSLYSYSTIVGAVQDLSDPGIVLGNFAGANAGVSSTGNGFAILPNIQSNWWKCAFSIGGEQNFDGTNQVNAIASGFWKSTAKIQSMTFSPTSGTVFKAGSILSVLGVR